MSLKVEGIPTIDKGWEIRNAAWALYYAADGIHTQATSIKQTWSGLSTPYHAPEQDLVLQAMNKPDSDASSLEDKVMIVRDALIAYGNTCDTLAATRKTLVADVQAFGAEKTRRLSDNDYFFGFIEDGVDKYKLGREEEALEGRIRDLQSDLDSAQITCANKIISTWGGETYELADEASAFDKTTWGLTPEGYLQMSRAGDAPWGAPDTWKDATFLNYSYMMVRGAGESLYSLGVFALDLQGKRGAGRQKAAWTGLGMMAFTFATYKYLPESRDRMVEYGKSVVSWDTWDTSPVYTLGSFMPDVAAAAVTWGAGGAATATAKGGARAAVSAATIRLLPRTAKSISDLRASMKVMKASGRHTFDASYRRTLESLAGATEKTTRATSATKTYLGQHLDSASSKLKPQLAPAGHPPMKAPTPTPDSWRTLYRQTEPSTPHWTDSTTPHGGGRSTASQWTDYQRTHQLTPEATAALSKATRFDGKTFEFGRGYRNEFEAASRHAPPGTRMRYLKYDFEVTPDGKLNLLNEDSLSPRQRGNAFNAAHWKDFDHNEVFLRTSDGKKKYLDSYTHGGQMVERKYRYYQSMPDGGTRQFQKDINEAKSYSELDTPIPDTPTNAIKFAKRPDLLGDVPDGTPTLQIPRQQLTESQLAYAELKGVKVIDENGEPIT